ncbi:putative component of NuA3 histone acetyltransferase complex [Extremus antarcticus]|uniref:uS12 prolyl 3,4-dihydroxylase n=1 Tax=Extremus antarcticus TaxID=702011 RepID=A0AAJ0DDZ3_9PEZI|nr:putative component of NuA3 histone acetyltransferase complex [Extremus antarcticus]
MKRKAEGEHGLDANGHKKKQATEPNVHVFFGEGLLASETVQRYAKEYADSAPYKHAVVSSLMNHDLLRSVRSEILDNIHFTPKETDIYKIHQSGDLANLDGLPASALEKLPSLLKLRDALYSYDFRQWLSTVTVAGALSGKKTDMAVNVYVPGCHLLCHDDVIGSRRVSYILYLTDPDIPWQAEWGGALRLYPTEEMEDESGKVFKVPKSEWTQIIPPAWNQLSFFAVQPGESFHDVEEVYHRSAGESEADGGRVRMAISGWFHIPQEGEEGFEPGLEEKLAEKSSLKQLQGKADQFDEPQDYWHDPIPYTHLSDTNSDEGTPDDLSEKELEFLLHFMTPNYLTPDTVEELNEIFTEESTLQLSNFLNTRFADSLKQYLEGDFNESESSQTGFKTSRPPHKHRYQYMQRIHIQPPDLTPTTVNPLERVQGQLLRSLAFRKWLALVTGLTLKKCSVIARRFRRGLDYQLAQGYEGEDAQLEYCLCVTPTSGWGADDDEATEENGDANGKGKQLEISDEDNVGGYELYMAGDDPDHEAEGSDDGVEIPAKLQSQTGAGDRRNTKRKKADPAVYQAAADDEDDGILISNPASWNTLSVVLRDRGTVKFVKYVSKRAPGDRYDFIGAVQVEPDDDEDDEDDE